MPDKKYLIEIPDMPDGSGIWDAAKWERNKDKFMAKYPTANVFELGQYDENDTDEHDQFMLTFEDDMESSGVWDAAKWERNKEAFAAKYPNAQVDRVRYIDYWGNKAQSDKARMDELQQPDEARNARLAEMGYYDDITGGQVEFGLDEPSTIGLRPLSSAIEEDIVSGEPSYLDPKVEEFFANDGEHAARQMELNRLREEYERNPRIIEQREYEAQMARYAEDLEKQIISDMESDVDEYHAAQGAVAKHSQDPYGANQVVQAMRMAKGEDVSKDLVENEKLERYQSALKLLQQAKDAREVAGKGLGGGIADTAKDWVRNAATQSDIEMYNEVGNILTSLEQKVGNLNEVSAEDIENNLSNDEKALIRAFFEYNAAMAEAGEDMSAWYKGGKIFAESIPFMMEFLVTGGLANAAGRAATSWMGKGFGRWIAKSARGTAARAAKKVVAKSVSGVAKTLVAAGARTLVAPTTYKNIAEQSVQYGEDGHLDRGRNMVNAAVDSYIEQLSEMSGAAFGKILGGAGRLALGKTAFDKIGAWFGDNMTMQALSRLGFHGLPEEVGEEIFGNALRTITGVDKEALGRMFEKDEFAAMIIGFAPMTLIGAGVSAAKMGAVSIGAANAGRRMRQDLSRSYTDEQIDQVEMSLDAAKDANEIAEAIRPIIMGMSAAGAPAHEIQSVWDYALAVAKKKAMISAQSVQEMQLTEAKIREAEEQVGGRFWIENEDGTRDVKQVVLKNGSTVYVVSKPDQDGRVATINTATGQKGTALPDDISEESWNGTLNAFGAGLVMADRTQREEQRMQEDRATQIAAVRDRLSSDPRINVGTEGSPVYLVAQSFNDAGVRYVAQDGTTGNISWEQAADSIGMPIVVKTDAQIAQEEADALVAAAAERRAKRAKADEVGTIERDNAVEDTENAVADANSAAAHIPMNEDGTVNEAAFWEQNPEEYVKWNDEQNKDGGQDSLQQIAVTRAELMGLLNEANAAQNTSNPGIRKAAKREVERLSDKIARLDAIEQTYMQNLEEEKKAIQQTAATPTSFMSEEELESMDAQYQGILGKTRVQSERVRVMQEYLDKLSEGSIPIKVLTVDNFEEVMRAANCSEKDIARVRTAIKMTSLYGTRVAGFASAGTAFVMADTMADISEARITYVHERQHILNSSNSEAVTLMASALGTREKALEVLSKFVSSEGMQEYENDSLARLADEIICRSMEIAYTSAEFSLDLQEKGIPQEVVNVIKNIDDGQKVDKSLAAARRSAYANGSNRTNLEENGRNSEQVSSGLLGSEETGSTGSSSRGIGDGAEGSEVNPSDNEGPSFRITPEMDAEYLAAVESGDMDKAQQMVLAAAKIAMPDTKVVDENGNPKVVYHGSQARGITEFYQRSARGWGKGTYFADNREQVEDEFGYEGVVYSVFLDLKNPYTDRTRLTEEEIANTEAGRNLKEGDYFEEFYEDGAFANKVIRDLGYDGVAYEGSNNIDGIEYVAFSPNQIKSAEPVTYDDNGNVIPLSERFNPENNDIRFRTTETNPEDNLSEETIKELADKGLVMDGGVVMSDEYAELKQTLGYETPIERGAGIDDLRFAVVTMPGWKKNYLTYEQADKRIVQILEAFAARITANELVNGVIAKGTHKSSKKTKDGKLVEAGPLRSNISYVVTFDLDTTCPRTFQYLNFVRKIERRIGRPLTQVECIQLNEMMRMYGQQIPCVYCYAENKRQAMKQYFNNYITARHAVLSAETDAEALEHMYGREKEGTDPKTVLTEAAYKVFKKWRKDPKGKYNPTMRILWHQYDQARNSVLSLLDMRYAEAVVNTDSANDTIAQFVAGELGITNKTAVREIEEIVVEWKWNTIEGRKHDDYTPVDEDDLYANENALEVWRDMVLYAKSASGAKNVNRYVPYTDELKHVDQATRDYINGMGGLRMHSTNDFRIDYVFDYFQFMADMAAARMFGHTYTKSPEFVRIFGNSGYKINMSIAAYQDENGVIRPNVDEGFDWDEVKELRRLFPHAGAMLMATSDEQLQMALDSDWIDMIIPFHHSGLPKAVWYNMRLWTDYTSVQNESFLNTEERTAMLLEAGVEIPRRASTETIEELFNEHFGIEVQYGKSGKRVKPHFLPGPTIVDGVNIPGHNNDHQRYLELCRQWGVKPRFQGIKVKDNTPEGGGREVDITEHPRYMTLVKETARTDSPQVPIQFNFDQPSEALGGRSAMDYAFDELEARAMAESELAGRKVSDIYTSLNNDQFGIVDQFISTIIKHKQETGEDYPMDYLTPESREWFMVQRKALEEAFKDIATIPYHRNEYDEQGNLVSGPGLNLEEKKVVDIVGEAKKAQKKHDAKAKKGKKSKKDDVRLRVTARTEEQREQLFDKAKRQYGVTNNFNATGYMLPDGSLLDFSESNDGGDPNRRSLDHRDIEGIIMDEGREYDSRYRYIVDFVNEGAIRMLPESAGFQLSVPPTAEQRSRLMDYIYKHNGEVIMEITDENGSNVAYVEYDRRTSPMRIMRDMNGYFNEGKIPEQDVRFRIAYHGSEYDFNEFSLDHGNQGASTRSAFAKPYGIYATDQKDRAMSYSLDRGQGRHLYEVEIPDEGIYDFEGVFSREDKKRILDYIQSERPELYNKAKRAIGVKEGKSGYTISDFLRPADMKNLGYKGFVKYMHPAFRREGDPLEYVIFDPMDVRIVNHYATKPGEADWFDKNDIEKVSVNFRISNNNQSIFVSNAAKAVEAIKQEKATPEQWLKMIEKAGGLKAGEDKWMGLSDWLKASDKKTLTKAEVLDFINENMIIIEEQHYSDTEAGKESVKILNRKYPNWEEAFSFEWDGYMEEPYASIYDNQAAVELYNKNHEDKVELDDDGEFVDMDTEEKVREFGKTLAEIYYGQDNEIRPIHGMHADYTTNGLFNLHEIALTVPSIEPYRGKLPEVHFFDAGEGRAIAWIRFGETNTYATTKEGEEYKAFVDNMLRRYHIDEEVKLSRFGTIIVPQELLDALTDEQMNELQRLKVASMEASDKTEQRVLVIDEIQSQRHQDGREKGYKDAKKEKAAKEAFEKASREHFAYEHELREKYGDDFIYAESDDEIMQVVTEEEYRKFDSLRDAYLNARLDIVNPRYGAVPDAPFDKNWHELAMKRMLRYAAENGYDAIAWTKGEQQAERYGLQSIIDDIWLGEWQDTPSGKARALMLYHKNGHQDGMSVGEDGIIIGGSFKGSSLSDVVGKELAVRFLSEEGAKRFKGEEIKVGGEGMKGFYDKMLPAFMNKYGKKWGVKVEDIDLSNLEKGLTMHSVPVNEEMKASVMDGQVMFKITPHKASLEEIENMFYALNKDKALVPIFRKALDFCNEVHADIEFISDVEMAKKEGIKRPIFAALGWAWGNKIRFNADGFNASSAQENAATILHEMLHMATAYVLAQKESYLKKVDADLAKAKEDIDAIFEEIKSKYPMQYGTTDQDEMVAEMSNPSFRKAMKEGNLWERFVNSVRDIIGLEKTDNNRLDATMDALNRILDNPDFVLFDDILQDLAQNSEFVAFRITPEIQEEMDAIKASAIVMGNFMKAPNGKQTNLSEEQWLMVRTENFKKWFGNWENDPENASKVVDENGEPMVVYHGTAGTINKFEDQQRSPGLWFVDREDVAKGYAESASVEFGEEMNVVPVFLNLRNPRTEDAHGEYPAEFALKSYVENDNGVYQEFDTYEEAEAYRKENVPDGWVGASTVGDQHDLVERARELGHDGVIMKDMHDQAAYAQTRVKGTQTNYVVFDASQIKSAVANSGEFSEEDNDIRFSIRTKPAPKNTGIGYKVFYLKDGKLYPPMVANQGGVDTPVGVWLDAEEGTRAGVSKTGRPQVKQGGKGTQGGSGTLAYRPGWHLGEIPYAIQFNRKDESGDRTLFPADFVWAEVEYANDVDYQEEAMSYGMNANGKFQHSLAGLPKLPADGSYRYRTNPNPETDPWIITGAMKVNRLLTPSEVDQMVIDAGREPQKRQEGAVTDEQIEALNKDLGLAEEPRFRFSAETADDVDIKAMRGISTLRAFNMGFNEMRKIFYDVAEETEKTIMELRAKQNRTAYDEERLARAEQELKAAHRRIGWWESVNSQLIDTTPYEPDLKEEDMDLEPRTLAEFIAQFLTMHMTRVNKQSVDKDGRATIKKVNKRAGVMLTQETLRRELGWSEKDWSGFRYIISETEGKSLDEIAEMISEDTEAQSIFVGMDVMEIKDAVIDFLQGIGSYAEIRDYIKNERVREAKDYADYVNRRMAEGIERIESGTGMTVEEYNAHIVAEELKEIESILKDIETSNIYGKFEELTSEENEANQKSLLEGARRGVYESDQIISDYGDGAVDSESSSDEGPREDSGRSDSGDVGDRGGEAGRPGAPNLGHKKKGLVQKPLELSSESAPVDEVVSKGRQKAINENVEANAIFSEKMQRLNDSLAKLRAMLAAQREYDVNTVKIITGLANELMQIGRLTDMSRSEIKRLLSVIKDATGKEDLSIAVERLMDIMIANQLRSGKSKVAELMKIKASKVNASGVEVRGSLDVAGQQMVQTFKEAVARAMTDEALAENIAIEEENLGSDSEVIRKNAENRLAGYYLARQYREDILASEAEEKALRKEISDAKEQYDAGKMDKTAFKEFQKSCYDAIRENRMQRVTSYERIANQLAAKLAGSILNAKALEDSEKARIERIHHYANSDMQGMPSVQQGEVKKGIWNNTILRFLFKPLATFDQMLRSFAPKSRNGEGYLWRFFMGGWMDASEREFKGIQAAHERLDAKVRSMFAGAKRWSDLFSIEKKMPVMKVKFWDGEKMADFALTQGNLLYIYMVNKMTDGKMKLRKMGITEEDVNNIARELDPRFLELADWIQDTFLPGLREKYNALHEKMFGAPMAAIDNYFPIRVLANARTRDVDISVEESSSKPSTITGSIIKRTKNSLALDILGSDAFDVVLEHIEQMEHWAAFAEFNRDLNTLLSYRKFRNRVQNMRGIYGAGTTVWNNFRATAEIAAGVYKPAVKSDSLDKLITNIAKGVTGAKISFRVYTALKQFLSAPAFVSDASAVELIKSLANPYKAWKWAMDELPLFEKRWKSRQAGDSRLMETESDWKLWKTKIVELAGRYGMTPNAFVDALTVSIGAKSIYETKRKEYIRMGYPAWQAEKKAKRDATVLFNESQQSNESAFLSAAQVDRTVASILITVFRNSSMGYQRMYVDALRNIKNALRKGYKAESLEYMTKLMVRDGLTQEQAERAANRIYNRSFVRNAVRLATFGFLVQFAWNLGPYMAYLLMGDDDDEKKDMIKDAAVRGLVGGPVEGLAAGQAISSVLGDVAMKEAVDDPMLKLPAASDMEAIFNQLDKDPVRAVNDIFNLVIQSGIGVNPQTISDAVVAIIDGCNGDMETSKEAAFALMRILQTPQSQIEKLYMEEIDFTAEEALDMNVREFAERYAKYKIMRTAPLTKWAYSDEKEKELEERYIKTFTKKASEMERTHGTEEAQQFYEYYDTEYEEVSETLRELKQNLKDAVDDTEETKRVNADIDSLLKSEEFKRFEEMLPHIKAYEKLRKVLGETDDPEEREQLARDMIDERNQAVQLLREEEND